MPSADSTASGNGASARTSLDGKRVLVIGGAGFIGSHVVEELLREPVASITVFDNFCRGSRANLARALKDDRVSIFPDGGDILHVSLLDRAMAGCDVVFHLAALWLLQCQEYPEAAFEVNVRGTFNVIDACRRHKVGKLVYSSSASVYGDARVEPMTEEHPFDNRTFYGATKIAGEQMLTAFGARYGLRHTGLRYMNVYGERQDYLGAYVAVIMKILDRIDAGEPPVLHGDGNQAYDFVHVSDVARANICAAKSGVASGYYNVGTGGKTTLRELAEMLLRLTGSNLPIRFEPAPSVFVTNRVGSTTRARADLGFAATVPLEEGLRRLIAWRREDQATRGGNTV